MSTETFDLESIQLIAAYEHTTPEAIMQRLEAMKQASLERIFGPGFIEDSDGRPEPCSQFATGNSKACRDGDFY